jgi:hypothetical protein
LGDGIWGGVGGETPVDFCLHGSCDAEVPIRWEIPNDILHPYLLLGLLCAELAVDTASDGWGKVGPVCRCVAYAIGGHGTQDVLAVISVGSAKVYAVKG